MARVVHFEFGIDDAERAARFYREALDWTIDKWDGPFDYWLVTTGPDDELGINGALMKKSDGLSGTQVTIAVDSIDDALAKIVAAGGEIVQPKETLPGVGQIALCRDTEGNTFGVIQPEPMDS
jgi:uncharacterized protein